MKRFVSLLLAALLLLGLGACGQKAADDDAVRIVGRYKVVPNDNERKDTYPYTSGRTPTPTCFARRVLPGTSPRLTWT